jgi:hypothetical protein
LIDGLESLAHGREKAEVPSCGEASDVEQTPHRVSRPYDGEPALALEAFQHVMKEGKHSAVDEGHRLEVYGDRSGASQTLIDGGCERRRISAIELSLKRKKAGAIANFKGDGHCDSSHMPTPLERITFLE